jgi:glycosyltransferase involved in cell wall biosynthesis
MSKIIHISYDYGDPKDPGTTTAVLNLVNQVRRITNSVVFDMSRTTSVKKEFVKQIDNEHIKINSFGLPMGITHRFQLNRAYNKIIKAAEEGKADISDVSIIHAHKLTFEGHIGYLLSKKLNVPLFVTLRQTDFWVFRTRPDLKKHYRRVILQASKLFYLVPIMLPLLRRAFGESFYREHIKNKLVYLPNIIISDAEPVHTVSPDAPLITILRFTKPSVKRKNIKNLLKALSQLSHLDFKLKMIGGGDYLPEVKSWVEEYNLSGKITFAGHIPNNEINKQYACAKAFIMPSLSESFGLVYAESLLNGTPILYSKGVIGFHGVFKNVGSAVNPYSVDSIKKGIINILDKNGFYREEIRRLHEEGAFSIFSPENAYNTYKKAYEETAIHYKTEFKN